MKHPFCCLCVSNCTEIFFSNLGLNTIQVPPFHNLVLRLGWYPFSHAGTNNVLKIDYARLLLQRSWEWQLLLEEFVVRPFNSLTSISASAAPASLSICAWEKKRLSGFPKMNPAQAFIIINAKQSFDFQINSRFVFFVRHFNKIF